MRKVTAAFRGGHDLLKGHCSPVLPCAYKDRKKTDPPWNSPGHCLTESPGACLTGTGRNSATAPTAQEGDPRGWFPLWWRLTFCKLHQVVKHPPSLLGKWAPVDTQRGHQGP